MGHLQATAEQVALSAEMQKRIIEGIKECTLGYALMDLFWKFIKTQLDNPRALNHDFAKKLAMTFFPSPKSLDPQNYVVVKVSESQIDIASLTKDPLAVLQLLKFSPDLQEDQITCELINGQHRREACHILFSKAQGDLEEAQSALINPQALPEHKEIALQKIASVEKLRKMLEWGAHIISKGEFVCHGSNHYSHMTNTKMTCREIGQASSEGSYPCQPGSECHSPPDG
jgi:hypothetical protein